MNDTKQHYYINDICVMCEDDIQTADEARQKAIDWQIWQQEESLSYGELAEWQGYFEMLAEKFNLTDEFKENGII
jgi:hypothetical protein